MNKLFHLETTFQDYLLQAKTDIFQHMVGTTNVPIETRLAIYSNAYRARLHEALAASYSILQSYLGEASFEELCYSYIDIHPSNFRSIRWYGDELASFLSQHDVYKAYPYLAELAAFEWALALAFDGRDGPVIQLEDMQHIPPDVWADMKLHIHPTAYRLSLSWNVVQIWQAMADEQPPPEAQQHSAPLNWVIWRNERLSQFSSLTAEETWALDAAMKGKTFGDICEGLCHWIEEDAVGMHAASLLKGWITAGLLSRIEFDTK